MTGNFRSAFTSLTGLLALALFTACAPSDPGTFSVSSSYTGPEYPAQSGVYRVVTEHELAIEGELVKYDAIAGETRLSDLQGNPTANIFSFSYIRTNTENKNRPVLFVFNGGPGSASLWIHMGAIGPKRVVLDNEVNPSNVPPFGIENNPYSVLNVADIVFIDPVGTGFSHALKDVDPKTFWGVDEDAESIAQFIELWLNEHGRWNSPKYVLGESYGTVRAAVLPRALMGSPIYNGVMRGITLDGIALLGTTLTINAPASETPTAEARAAEQSRTLPGLAATAAYHRLTPGADNVQATYETAKTYASEVYEPALLKLMNGTLDDALRARISSQVSGMLGIDETALGEDLYIPEREYAKLALGPKGLEVGMYDSRYTLPLKNSGHDPVADDPAMARYVPGFVASFNQMIRDDLKVRMPRAYNAITWKDLLSSWNWDRSGVIPSEDYAQELAWSMRRNADLRVFVASGYYDLVTTPAEAYASLMGAGLPMDRVAFKDYESGHMLYLGGTSQAFADDLRAFMTKD